MYLYKALKWTRIVIAIIFFLGLIFLFVDFSDIIPPWFYKIFTYLQFTPSLLKFLNVAGLITAGFLFVILLTLLFGRIYCSTICPLGTLQDILIRIEKKLKIKKRFTYVRSYHWIWYSILILSIVVLIFGSAVIFSILDPYSNFGKIISSLLKPVYIGLNNLGALIIHQFDSFALYHVNYKLFNWPVFLFALFFFIILFIMTLRKGRLFCNSICPVGALLGFISKLSVFRIKIHETTCNKCWLCSLECKGGCIHAEKMTIDFSRCVGCMNCLTVCPENAIGFGMISFKKTNEKKIIPPDSSKRSFIISTVLFTLGLNNILKSQSINEPEQETTIPEDKKFPVLPPGALSFDHFNRFCTACHLCISACPTQVIQPSFLQYGLQGIFQPYMEYHKSFCNYDCTKCLDICPNGALLQMPAEEKKLTQLGKVHFIQNNCIVETRGTECGACSEHCPTKAVSMKPYKGLSLPEINQDICIGCGACEYACPTTPYKAIYVDGNTVQVKAKKPESKKLQAPDSEEDFPF